MTLSDPVVIWAAIGLFLILAEIILPGGIVILLGAACLVVSSFLWAGFVEGIAQSMTLWFITSIILMLLFRGFTQKMIGGDAHVDNTDEAIDVYGQLAVVVETIGPGEHQGRINFQGSDWPAVADGSEIGAGESVRIICQQNIAYVVEPDIGDDTELEPSE
ncbi:NfeD family protein [Parashewanella spongiae]|uniref:NfeD family protein n=1 Tax=Parashewanella spongiae TaxID=342950 RepID=A0A3A6UBH0_9GAMM|nr:NfeD family protein [Parashewanella spongiae]MCL1078947.1 NfeD family protein [Parashewanella spongiae]RJY19358.1 NfeD family protein [Parashewanella spongiae]